MVANNKMVRLSPALAAMLLLASAFLVSTVIVSGQAFDEGVPAAAPEESEPADDYDYDYDYGTGEGNRGDDDDDDYGLGGGGLEDDDDDDDDDEPVERGCPSSDCVTNQLNQCQAGCLCVSFVPFTTDGVCIGICCQGNRTPPSPSPSPWPFPWWPRPSPPKRSPPLSKGRKGRRSPPPPKSSPRAVRPPSDMVPTAPFLSVPAVDEDHA